MLEQEWLEMELWLLDEEGDFDAPSGLNEPCSGCVLVEFGLSL